MADGPVLSDLQRALLDYITNDFEPTWIMLQQLPEAGGDRKAVERELRDLQAQGLVQVSREASGNPAPGAPKLDHWWGLTDAGWELLGETKPFRYDR